MNHLLRVALRVMVHYGVWEPDVICAALLHDTVEDHADDLSTTGRPGAFALLTADFGTQVAEVVAAVTNPVYAPGSDKDSQYREHVVDGLAACPWARVIKLSDFTDNGVGVIHTDGEKALWLARKYAPLVPALAELAARSDTPYRMTSRPASWLSSAARPIALTRSWPALRGGEAYWRSRSHSSCCSASRCGCCTATPD